MNTHVIRAMRVLAPNDLRLIWRDGFLLGFIMLVLPLVGWLMRVLVPFIGEELAEWVVLEDYYGLILATVLVAGQPVLLGFVIGVLFIEERDEGTLNALRASPLSLRSFLGYRMLTAMFVNIVLTCTGLLAAGLVSVSWLELVATTSLASLGVPVIAFIYAIYIKNKVQALMLLKPIQAWGGLPTLLFFAPSPWQWIGSVFLPLYYPMRLFWSAADGHTEWWLILPGVIIPGMAIVWLFRRFERAMDES